MRHSRHCPTSAPATPALKPARIPLAALRCALHAERSSAREITHVGALSPIPHGCEGALNLPFGGAITGRYIAWTTPRPRRRRGGDGARP